MPRILIADDNSNIQRMAALALKDAGIEVIAVGNGEAAVRKICEVSPDLILADIFMPVRNGYEVCEFVKHDPKYANTPVLLLAGAFDPFDEHEAQRVHADGILKKPFVPPDPLINAVKTLLEKSAGERLMAVAVPAEAATSAHSNGTAAASTTTTATVAEPPAASDEEAEAQDFAPLSVVDFVSGPKKDRASGFASALSTEAPETDEPEPVVTASRDPVLGEPAFWVPEEMEREGEQERAPAAQESAADLTDHSWTSSSRPAPIRDDPDPPPMRDVKPLDLKPPATQPVPAASVHHLDLSGVAPVLPGPASEPAKEESAKEALAPELPPFEIASPPAVSALPAALSKSPAAPLPDLSAKTASAEDTLPLPESVVESATSSTLEIAPLQPSPLHEPETKLPAVAALHISHAPIAAESPLSVASNATQIEPPVTAVIRVAEEEESPLLELQDTLPAFPEFAAPSYPGPEAPSGMHNEATETDFAAEWPPLFVPVTASSPNAGDALQPAAEVAPAPLAPVPVEHEAAADAVSEPTAVTSLSLEAQEAVIQRVIERMQPQIVELVTRQILRPLVESLVRHELGK